jgi:serine/threonine protein kinase
MEQLLLTIDFMHKRKMVHRDIKLDNILVKKIEDEESFDVKVADFGLARFMPDGETRSPNEF